MQTAASPSSFSSSSSSSCESLSTPPPPRLLRNNASPSTPRRCESEHLRTSTPIRHNHQVNDVGYKTTSITTRKPPSPAPRKRVEVKLHNMNSPNHHHQTPQRLDVKISGTPVKRPASSDSDTSSLSSSSPSPRTPPGKNSENVIPGCSTPPTTHRDSNRRTNNCVTNCDSIKSEVTVRKEMVPIAPPRRSRTEKALKTDDKKVAVQKARDPSSPRRTEARTSSSSPAKHRGEVKGHGSPSTMRHVELPAVIRHPQTGESYKRGRLLGKVSHTPNVYIRLYPSLSLNFSLN